MQAGGSRSLQQVSELLLGLLRIGGNVPGFRDLYLVHPADVIYITGGKFLDDVSISVGGASQAEDWPNEHNQHDESYRQYKQRCFSASHIAPQSTLGPTLSCDPRGRDGRDQSQQPKVNRLSSRASISSGQRLITRKPD